MVNEKHSELLGQILDLLGTACQAAALLSERLEAGDPGESEALLEDLRAGVSTVRSVQEPLLSELGSGCAAEMLENVEDTLEEIRRAMDADQRSRAAGKAEYQLFPFLRQLREIFYFWGAVWPDSAAMERYYREEFAAHFCNPYLEEGADWDFRLSIVVVAYNHLEVTRRCVERLLEVTDLQKLNAELILIDHGSTDGTLEYFESLGVGRVIHFKRNVRMYMFTTLFQLCRSEYFAFVSNDVLVGRNWAENLLTCLESDERIIAAVPATPNISNLQMLEVPTNDPKAFLAWADRRNRSDPKQWDNRARLMPTLGMYRTQAVNGIGFADPYFYSMEFWDDDFSLRARRAGYRQILCGDAACYHFGSVTGKEGQIKEGTLVYGRKLFLDKNGVDAWSNGFCYDYHSAKLLSQAPLPQGEAALLGLDCGMGDTPMQAGNLLRRRNRSCRIWQLTSREAYLPDVRPFSQEALFVPNLREALASAFGGQRFTHAYIGRNLGDYEDWEALLEAVAARLAPGGRLVFFCANPYAASTVSALLRFSLPGGRMILLDPDHAAETAMKHFSNVEALRVPLPSGVPDAFIARHYEAGRQMEAMRDRLNTQAYYFTCRK